MILYGLNNNHKSIIIYLNKKITESNVIISIYKYWIKNKKIRVSYGLKVKSMFEIGGNNTLESVTERNLRSRKINYKNMS